MPNVFYGGARFRVCGRVSGGGFQSGLHQAAKLRDKTVV
jgi:hypothetical protein